MTDPKFSSHLKLIRTRGQGRHYPRRLEKVFILSVSLVLTWGVFLERTHSKIIVSLTVRHSESTCVEALRMLGLC